MFTYTFIIPHKNTPNLLQRCVNSIPRRDDIQIIVVDDNSDKIDWNTFKFDDDKCIELIKTHEGKGAGYARNVGLKHAIGKWILFADCDDFYLDGFLNTLDKYKDSDIEVVYFNFKGVYSDSHEIYPRYNKTTKYYSEYDNTLETLDKIRYKITMPWNKMVNTDFIKRFHIHFEEVPKCNDVFFSYMVAYFARHISVDKGIIYAWTFQKDSITNSKLSKDKCKFLLSNRLKYTCFYKYIGKESYQNNLLYAILRYTIYNGWLSGIRFFLTYLEYRKEFKRYESFYIKHIEKEIIKQYNEQE